MKQKTFVEAVMGGTDDPRYMGPKATAQGTSRRTSMVLSALAA